MKSIFLFVISCGCFFEHWLLQFLNMAFHSFINTQDRFQPSTPMPMMMIWLKENYIYIIYNNNTIILAWRRIKYCRHISIICYVANSDFSVCGRDIDGWFLLFCITRNPPRDEECWWLADLDHVRGGIIADLFNAMAIPVRFSYALPYSLTLDFDFNPREHNTSQCQHHSYNFNHSSRTFFAVGLWFLAEQKTAGTIWPNDNWIGVDIIWLFPICVAAILFCISTNFLHLRQNKRRARERMQRQQDADGSVGVIDVYIANEHIFSAAMFRCTTFNTTLGIFW